MSHSSSVFDEDDEGDQWGMPQHHQDLQRGQELPWPEDVRYGDLRQPRRARER